MLDQTGGLPAVPLDDAYIHFQFARSFAELRPLTYVAGGEPVPGATSLLWPALLAPLRAIGLRGDTIIWGAWLFGWLSLGLLAHETRELARGIVGRDTSIAAAAMVLVFGGHLWFAGSGMEVVPLAPGAPRSGAKPRATTKAGGVSSCCSACSRRWCDRKARSRP